MRDQVVRAFLKAAPDQALLAWQADWHLRGLNYHLVHIRDLYLVIGQEVGGRVQAVPQADLFVMHSPEMQNLMFEFHAFISLARITLDHLQRFATPSLTADSDNLPNSITDAIKGHTDFPLYLDFAKRQQELLRYLLDIRDCLVHHRSFATSDNSVVTKEGFSDQQALKVIEQWLPRPVVRTFFRRQSDGKIVVNVSLPDGIYAYSQDGNRGVMLREFTYNNVNLLTQSREFTRMCTMAVVEALSPLAQGKKYRWKKPRRDKQR